MLQSELDKDKTYCVGASPAPNAAVKIREYQPCAIPFNERWTQVGILYFCNTIDDWVILHCDSDKSGVSVERLCLAVQDCEAADTQMFAFEYRFSIETALSMLNRPFSYTKLRAFKTGDWSGTDEEEGLTCAEFLAECSAISCKQQYGAESKYFQPVDWQLIGAGKIERLV